MSRLLVSPAFRSLFIARNYGSNVIAVSNIGNRDIVGYGINGTPSYEDREDFPLPAVRFRPNTPDILELRKKEKGDWKALSIAEKKALYRASFCQTFAEMNAPTGEWKAIIGGCLILGSLSVWIFLFFKLFVYNPELPETFSEERKRKQFRRMLDLRINPITGLSSKWDHEKDDWKK
ncbi:hypothetical protein O3M35_010128 [Rhynocoris fuscipes]|uniref:Cytochrome c oxidase subunit 4 n=1 Tax=Rhynocoris fuscipes TaxID=488301 RepID=A0AAW1D028_9HEMI